MLRSLLQRLALICMGVMAALLLTEGVLRIATPATFLQRPFLTGFSWMVYDPVSGWRNRANFESANVAGVGSNMPAHLKINALGFRGADILPTKPHATLRIVCMGDSATFGLWNDVGGGRLDNDYSQELSDLIHARGFTSVDVINAGVAGYSSSHGLRQLMTQILDLEPDILTVRYGFNDHNPSWNPALRASEPLSPVWRFLLYRFHDWRLARLALTAQQGIGWLHPAPETVPWTSPEEFEANLRRFSEVSRSRGIHLLFLDYSLRPLERGVSKRAATNLRAIGVKSLTELYDRQGAYQKILRQTAQREGVPLLQTAADLNNFPASFSTSDMVHPGQNGARLIARLLYEKLSALGWLE